jgi:hypothetical protein
MDSPQLHRSGLVALVIHLQRLAIRPFDDGSHGTVNDPAGVQRD